MHTHYDNLKVARNAPPEIIRAAYKVLCQKYHPDKYARGAEAAERIMKILNAAYAVLSDPDKRREYDQTLDEMEAMESEEEEEASDTGTQDHNPKEEPKQGTRTNARESEAKPANHPHPVDMQELYDAILGEKNKIYYQAQFRRFEKLGSGLNASWNLSAFLFGGVWALYRKMYSCFFIFLCIAFITRVIDETGSPGLSVLVILISWIAFPVYANSLYQNNLTRKIAEAKRTIKDGRELIEYLRYKGGVHTWVAWVFGGLPVVGIIAAILIPQLAGNAKQLATTPASTGVRPETAESIASRPWSKFAPVQPESTSSEPKDGKRDELDDFLDAVQPETTPSEPKDAETQFNRGVAYANGQGVQQNYAEAARWWSKAAQQGHAGAQYGLGFLLANGQGVPQNYAEAVKWFRVAADQGLSQAQVGMGWAYMNGLGGLPLDYQQAAYWYTFAARQGDHDGYNNLGWLYENGLGVKRDYDVAANLYREASKQGNKEATERLQNLTNRGSKPNHAKNPSDKQAIQNRIRDQQRVETSSQTKSSSEYWDFEKGRFVTHETQYVDESDSGCEVKAVMTDEEIRKCRAK